jgi:hypothetical protein
VGLLRLLVAADLLKHPLVVADLPRHLVVDLLQDLLLQNYPLLVVEDLLRLLVLDLLLMQNELDRLRLLVVVPLPLP